jgi:hypothetical protein
MSGTRSWQACLGTTAWWLLGSRTRPTQAGDVRVCCPPTGVGVRRPLAPTRHARPGLRPMADALHRGHGRVKATEPPVAQWPHGDDPTTRSRRGGWRHDWAERQPLRLRDTRPPARQLRRHMPGTRFGEQRPPVAPGNGQAFTVRREFTWLIGRRLTSTRLWWIWGEGLRSTFQPTTPFANSDQRSADV